MKLMSNGITIEVTHPADIAFYKKAGYREVPTEKAVSETVPEKPKGKPAGKKSAEKAVSDDAT